ncbi:unnamed protein product [Rotaria sordida]|uniref:Uncharacterized protein n=1 Tax=Rotaria sordida TaxID=392033 RepID=A0A815AJJ5_9BILA|nr:unnamed protein product [Rotaria sordida]
MKITVSLKGFLFIVSIILTIFVSPTSCLSCPPGPTAVGMCGCCNRDAKKNETCHTGDANFMVMNPGFGICVPQADLSFLPSYYLCERRQNYDGQHYCLVSASNRNYIYPMYQFCSTKCIDIINFPLDPYKILNESKKLKTTANLLSPLKRIQIKAGGSAEKLKLSQVYDDVVGLIVKCVPVAGDSKPSANTNFHLMQSNNTTIATFNGIFKTPMKTVSWTTSKPIQVNQINIDTLSNSITCTNIQLQYLTGE